MTTGEKIKQARKRAGITQQQLADRLGISYVVISQYENNKRNPKVDTIYKIASALEIDVSALLSDQYLNDYYESLIKKYASSDSDKNTAIDHLKRYFNQIDVMQNDLLSAYSQLNTDGQQVAVERVQELTEIKKYRKEQE